MSTSGKKEKDRKRRKGEGETSNKKFEKKKENTTKKLCFEIVMLYTHYLKHTAS